METATIGRAVMGKIRTMANTGKQRTKTLGVPVSEAEERIIREGAEMAGEDVAGFMRRLAIMAARRRLALGKGGPQ